MPEARGVVVALEDGYAQVQVDASGCGRCHEAGGCGGNPLNQFFGKPTRLFRTLNPENSVIGECVTLVIADGSIRRSAVRAYVWPLILLLLGAFVGLALDGELGAMLGALVGLLGAVLTLRRACLATQNLPTIRREFRGRKLLHISEDSA